MLKLKILKQTNYNNLIKFHIILQVILQTLDGITTYIGVTGGYGFEANPLVRYLMECLGQGTGLLLVKSVALILICGLLQCARKEYFYHTNIKLLYRVLVVINIFYIFALYMWLYAFCYNM